MPSGYPTVIPMIAYEDGPAAMDWLATAFGFTERTRMVDPTGRLSHGEMETNGGGVIMLASPSPHYRSPKHHRETCADAAKWSEVPYIVDGYLVYVDDITAHHARALEAGASMLGELEDTDHGKLYRVEDLEGHRWMFMERS